MYFVVDFYTTTILTIIMIVYQIVYVSFFWKKKKDTHFNWIPNLYAIIKHHNNFHVPFTRCELDSFDCPAMSVEDSKN